MIDSDGM